MKMKELTKTDTAATPAQRRVVHLECQASDAKAVFLAGTFNDWQPDIMPLLQETSGFWSIDLELAPGVYDRSASTFSGCCHRLFCFAN